jgi:hypothetical protein
MSFKHVFNKMQMQNANKTRFGMNEKRPHTFALFSLKDAGRPKHPKDHS